MNFTLSSILAGLIFSSIGLFVFRRGKQESNLKLIAIGICLFVYTYFTSNMLADWGIGIALSYASYYFWSAA